jgi:hypothetical protein
MQLNVINDVFYPAESALRVLERYTPNESVHLVTQG